MKFDIRHVYGHYELYIDGKFHGSYDTVNEAASEIDRLRTEQE